jgi:multicomponent Na+:H+ antiporter subunit D
MGTTCLAPSGGKVSIPLPGVTQSRALWTRVSTKWYLLLGGIQSNQWAFVAALLASTLINIALFFRIFDKGFFVHAQKNGIPGRRPFDATSTIEAPLSMLIPAILLALAILSVGLFNQAILNKLIQFAVPVGL